MLDRWDEQSEYKYNIDGAKLGKMIETIGVSSLHRKWERKRCP